jgi:hypothetical protein
MSVDERELVELLIREYLAAQPRCSLEHLGDLAGQASPLPAHGQRLKAGGYEGCAEGGRMGEEGAPLCPLLRGRCLGRACAWWVALEGRCALAVVAESIGALAAREGG